MEEFKKKGNDAFKTQQFAEAIQWYSKAIEKAPTNETLYSNRAASYSSLNQDEKALEDAEKCIQLKPNWIKGHFRKGVAYQKLQRYNESVRAFENALKVEPNNPDVQEKLKSVRATLKAQVERADLGRERDPKKCKEAGNAFFKDGKYDDAISWYSRAIELTESNPDKEVTAASYCNRAACHAQSHSYKRVIGDCDSAIMINPQFGKAFLRRAMANEGLEKWAKAAEDYKKVTELEGAGGVASTGYHRCSKFARDMM